MKNLYLKFDSEEQARSVCPKLFEKPSKGWSPDIVGTIYNDDGIYDDEGQVVSAPTVLEGFHVNLICEEDFVIDESYIINPANPKRKWL